MYSPQHFPHDDAGSGEARAIEAMRQIQALDDLARQAGTVLSIDRAELLEMLHRDPAATGGGR